LVESIEERWPVGKSYRPTYIVASDTTDGFANFIGKNQERRHRVFAITSVSDATPNARFVIRYNQKHEHEQAVTREFNPGSTYDGFYLTAYAALASRGASLAGVTLAKSISRLLPPGKPIEIGSSTIFDTIATLSSGGSVDLVGTQSGLDFDVSTGEAPVDFALLCSDVDGQGQATQGRESGIVYSPATGAVVGTMYCP
jgi:branched-chain amino acid transport system substrate-binding protein